VPAAGVAVAWRGARELGRLGVSGWGACSGGELTTPEPARSAVSRTLYRRPVSAVGYRRRAQRPL
jgi:hypothetical protein